VDEAEPERLTRLWMRWARLVRKELEAVVVAVGRGAGFRRDLGEGRAEGADRRLWTLSAALETREMGASKVKPILSSWGIREVEPLLAMM
jgi:hypothetical protein